MFRLHKKIKRAKRGEMGKRSQLGFGNRMNKGKRIERYLQSTLMERVFLMAPLTDMRRRKFLGRNEPALIIDIFF